MGKAKSFLRSRRGRQAVPAVLLGLLSAACTPDVGVNVYTPTPIMISAETKNTGTPGKAAPPFNLDTDCIPSDRDDQGACTKSSFKNLASSEDSSTQKILRNRLAYHLMYLSEQQCEQHLAGIVANSAAFNFGLSTLTSLLGGLGSIVTGADATRALSGSAAFTNATRDSLNESFYQRHISTAIQSAIRSKRSEKKTALVSALESKAYADYTGEALIVDIADYHNACSLHAGLTYLTDASRQSPSQREVLNSRLATAIADQGKLIEQHKNASPDLQKSLSPQIEAAGKRIESLNKDLMLLDGFSR